MFIRSFTNAFSEAAADQDPAARARPRARGRYLISQRIVHDARRVSTGCDLAVREKAAARMLRKATQEEPIAATH
jgi:hypothetical protein